MVSPQPSADWRILHATARRHRWQGEGWLSIKSFRGGRAHYSVGPGRCAVDDDSYLILNHGRTYLIDIDSPEPIESFCIFSSREFASDVLRNARFRQDELLDSPDDPGISMEFFEKTYPHDRIVSPLLRRLQRSHRNDEPAHIEEQLHAMLAALLRAHQFALREANELQNARPATRQELYRRVARARDYAAAMFGESVTLKDMARAAAMSPNHLLRTFGQVYRQTPHEFLTIRRLDEATRLLRKTELSATEICFEVGFQSLGSFSSLFKRRFGVSPIQYRFAKR